MKVFNGARLAGRFLKQSLIACSLAAGMVTQHVQADGNLSDYAVLPPLLSVAGSGDLPNVLVILDNSNSMDEAPNGQGVGSQESSSKSEIARGVIQGLLNTFEDRLRMGLMAYQQDTLASRHIHSAYYDFSFDSDNYDPDDEGERDSLTKKYHTVVTGASNDSDVYYNVTLPFYSNSNQGTAFCYSTTADFDNGSETYPGGPWDAYSCYNNKSNQEDNDGAWGSLIGNYVFSPTDSDLAQDILDFGTFLGWEYSNPTWFANTSPGKGYLHVGMSVLDSAQITSITNKTGTVTSYSTPYSSDPLRNGGLTPIEGTLETALDYFNGTTLTAAEGGGTFTNTNVCTGEGYVILVTDGMPSTDSSGNAVTDTETAIEDAATAAADLLSAGVRTYVVGFALPDYVDQTLLDKIADAGGTDTAFYADDAASLQSALLSAFTDIFSRTSSATAAAVVANNSAGVGAVYQALYTPEAEDLYGNKVAWTGSLHSIFIDDYGLLREDSNGNAALDGYQTDNVVEIFFDEAAQITKIRRYDSTSDSTPSGLSVEGIYSLDSINSIWNARNQLGNIASASITTQRSYGSTASSGRHVLTWIDADEDGVVDSAETISFDSSNSTLTGQFAHFDAADATEAAAIIDFVRGKEGVTYGGDTYRTREIDYDADGANEIWRLGDIVHSTPIVVGSPDDRYDIVYDDDTYATFRGTYLNRRQVAYVGANDGMLHAFNGGFWNNSTQAFDLQSAAASETQHPLGSEIWAYVPRSLIPHLQWLKDDNYGGANHVYYVDGSPRSYDVNIFTADTDHPGGWGTILVVPMRLGGGDFTVSIDPAGDGATSEVMRSAVMVFDITNPEVAPKLLAEITDDQMGFTTSTPDLLVHRVPSIDGTTFLNDWSNPTVNKWYLVFGSGPNQLSDVTSNQNAGLYYFDLNALSLVTNHTGAADSSEPKKDLGVSNAFVSDIRVHDWNNSFVDDVAYFGIASGTPAAPSGKLMRLKASYTVDGTGTVTGSTLNNSVASDLLVMNQPVISRPYVLTDDKGEQWVYFGTGRMFDDDDNTSTPQQSFYGVKEPTTFQDESITWSTSAVATSDIVDVSDVEVFVDESITTSNAALSGISSFDQLEAKIQTESGWKINLPYDGTDPSTRAVTDPISVSSILLFTDYTPDDDVCEPEGTSRVFAVHYKTGTAATFAPIGEDTSNTNNGAAESKKVIDLGQGMASAVQIHRGTGGSGPGGKVTGIVQRSTGAISSGEIELPDIISGRQSWIQLDF